MLSGAAPPRKFITQRRGSKGVIKEEVSRDSSHKESFTCGVFWREILEDFRKIVFQETANFFRNGKKGTKRP